MKTTTLCFAMVLLSTGVVMAQDSLTVEQAVQRVLATHPAIKQAMAQTGVSEARVRGTGSSRYPTIRAEAQYNRIGPVPELSIPNMGSFKFYPENNWDAHIAAHYTLLDFGRTSTSMDLKQSQVQSAKDGVELTKTLLALQTIRAFYSILFLQKSLAVQEEQIETLNEHLSINQKRVEAGTATNFDVLTTEVRVASAENQKIDIENALQKQKSALRQLLGLSEEAPFAVQGDFRRDAEPVSTDSLFEIASVQRNELILARDAERSAEIQYKLSSLGHWPSVSLNASYGVKNGYIPDLDKLEKNWVGGIRAEMPIFDGGRVTHQKHEAEAGMIAGQAHVKDVEQQIRSDVEQATADVRAAQSRIEISDIQFQQAHEAVKLAKIKYETGSITNLDLLDTETTESTAKLNQIRALYRYVISQVELDRAVGNPLIGI